LPYLDNNVAVNIMQSEVTAFLSLNPPAGSVAECRITSNNENLAGIDRVVCGLSNSYSQTASLGQTGLNSIILKPVSEQIELLGQDPENFIEVIEDYQATLSGGSFAYSYRVGERVVLRFLG